MKDKVLIFDLDGTLLNTIEDLVDSVNYMLDIFNYSQKTIDQVKNSIGDGVYKLIERVIPDGIKNNNFRECVDIFKKHYAKNMFNKTKAYDGILELLKISKNKGYYIAVASNKFDLAVKDLCNRYFPEVIDIALGENIEKGRNKKPSPDIIYKIIEKLQISKENAIYIGDSEVDIQTAKNAKIMCISVSWGYKSGDYLIQHGANNVINKPADLLKYI